MWIIPVIVFIVLGIFFAGRLGKEMVELDIVDISPSIVSIPGLFLYVREKRRRKEPLSFNFWAGLLCTLMIIAAFVVVSIA